MELSRPFIRLPFSFDVERLQLELAQFDQAKWMSHPNRVSGNSAIPLISLNGEDNDEFSGAMRPTPHLKKCQYIQQVMASFSEVLARSRLMKLGAGAQVSEHVDFNYHWYNRVRIHVPIVTFPEVTFFCGDEQIHMQAGECWIFDSWRRHNVVNASQFDRTHLVIDTAGSSRFWRTVRAMQKLSNDEASQQAQLIVFDQDAQNIEILTEQYNAPTVMAAGELEAIAKELIQDFSANPNNNPALVDQYAALLQDLSKDWREVWHLYGNQEPSWPHYQQLLRNTVQSLHQNPRALVTASNQVGVNPIIMQRLVRAALNLQQRH